MDITLIYYNFEIQPYLMMKLSKVPWKQFNAAMVILRPQNLEVIYMQDVSFSMQQTTCVCTDMHSANPIRVQDEGKETWDIYTQAISFFRYVERNTGQRPRIQIYSNDINIDWTRICRRNGTTRLNAVETWSLRKHNFTSSKFLAVLTPASKQAPSVNMHLWVSSKPWTVPGSHRWNIQNKGLIMWWSLVVPGLMIKHS